MKKFAPALLLILVFLGGLWYAWSQDFFKEKEAETSKPLVHVNVADVQSFSILSGDQQTELVRKDGEWSMTKPSAAPLNPNLTEGWMDSFNLLTQERVVEDKASDLAKYGLDKPSSVYKVQLADGTSQEVKAGSPTPVEGYVYVQLGSSPTVYQVGESSLSVLNKSPLDFVETSPVKFDYDQVKSVTFSWKDHKWSLTKNEADKSAAQSKWKLPDREIEGAEATQVLDKLLFMKTEEMPKRAAETAIKPGEWTLEVVRTVDGKEIKDTYNGRSDGKSVWIAKQDGDWVYAIPQAAMEEIATSNVKKGQP